ncbi:hypothetical protein [Nonomuraea sp. B19D2]|uniref:hypothetical protein n=1 Tax=Nonomuraea sp. B19D2 TaxID=3159561 RepID=UPI0032DA10F8
MVGDRLDGEPVRAKGEFHFGWVLGGRAVQDTWIMPGRHEPAASTLRAFHRTTVRFYDPDLGAWRSTWIEPVNARVRRFIGRPVDGDIILLSDEEDPWLRWRFTDITPSSARWLGETSYDNGATWVFDEEMILTRRSRRPRASGSGGDTARRPTPLARVSHRRRVVSASGSEVGRWR